MADAVLRELGVSSGGQIGFDRSRVRILVCDPCPSPDVVDLLRRCSYQVVAVQNARQVMEVLRAGISQVDLILAEVELPNKKGFKMLKYFMKEEQLKQIPIVMMSSRDEMAVVGKCLRLGAADYLVKPLRTNELLNLWTHMWRRRRMLGMTEKCLLSGSRNANEAPLDMLFADTSESNTNSTDLFSEDSKDQVRRSVMDGANSRLASNQDQARRNALDVANSNLANGTAESERPPVLELTLMPSSDLATVEHISRTDRMPAPPRRTELKIGESSAFLSYTRVSSREVEISAEKSPSLLQTMDSQTSTLTNVNERPTEWRQRLLSQVSDAHVATQAPVRTVESIEKSSTPWEPMNKQPRLPQTNESHKHSSSVLARGGIERSSVQNHGGNDRSAERQAQLVPQGKDGRGPTHPTVVRAPPVELREQSTSPWEVANNSTPRLSIPTVYMGKEVAPSNGWSQNHLRTRFPGAPVEQLPMLQMHIQNESLMGVPTVPPFGPSHHFPPNMVSPNLHASAMLPPSMHLYCGLEGHLGIPPGIPPMHMLQPGHAIAGPAAYSYYPVPLPVGQPTPHMWPAMQSLPVSERKLERAERREAALSKFRQKRKDRCFEKKIRYVSRKRLAEQRPRNRGQFVRRNNCSGTAGVDESEDEEDEEENESSSNAVDRYSVNRYPVCVSLG